MSRPENKNGQQGGQVRGVGKSHIVDPTIVEYLKKHVRKGDGKYIFFKTPSLEEPSPVIMACHIKIVAACTCCDI